ncbi:hypothetical protein C8Q79DRAFT_944037 [Trametes meyenii]|nr:hypothetical protein C8Q79DRAFT_944037 [Trametes meyenii]
MGCRRGPLAGRPRQRRDILGKPLTASGSFFISRSNLVAAATNLVWPHWRPATAGLRPIAHRYCARFAVGILHSRRRLQSAYPTRWRRSKEGTRWPANDALGSGPFLSPSGRYRTDNRAVRPKYRASQVTVSKWSPRFSSSVRDGPLSSDRSRSCKEGDRKLLYPASTAGDVVDQLLVLLNLRAASRTSLRVSEPRVSDSLDVALQVSILATAR